MIISPPFIRIQNAGERDASWVNRMMPVDSRRGFPLNARASWHGGVHVTHTDTTSQPGMVRAIADGEVVSFRAPSSTERRDAFPLNYNGRTDDGYVLLKHKTDIGENCNVVYYSLYMHLMGQLAPSIRDGARIWRKDPIGQSGMVDNVNAFHFQVFCDNENMLKLTGRTTPELDISRDGRTDTVYGDIHFYLPPGTRFYESVPDATSPDTDRLNPVHTSTEPLFVSMVFEKGDCSMVTRRQNTTTATLFDMVGESLVNTDASQTDDVRRLGLRYEYNLYGTACRLYPQNPSAGFELLRFGRIISTGHETLTPASAPLWRTVSFPGGTGMVNLASPDIKKFSDADFPHWSLRYTDNHLSDTENHVPENIIRWRNNVSSDLHEAASSAGFYWVARGMAPYADNEHALERCSINTRGNGIKIYYRSQAFWRASAAVNLPNQVNNGQYQGLNGFDARCCVYGSAIAVLTEQKFPDSNNTPVNEKPESDQLRRE